MGFGTGYIFPDYLAGQFPGGGVICDIYTGVEALIGEWLKRRGGPGVDPPVQVHTKYVPDLDRLATHSRADVVRGVDRSLARLGVDRLDLVQLHWWDYDVPGYVDAAAWLDELRRAGKIRHIGLTNFDQKRLAEIVAAGIPVVSHQLQYSVLDRRPANGMAAQCARDGIGLLCYGALAGGFLSDRYLDRADPAPPLENRSLVKYRLIIDEFGGWDRFQGMLGGARRGRGAPRSGHRRGGAPLGARSTRRVGRHRRRAPRAAPRTGQTGLRSGARRGRPRGGGARQSASSGPNGDTYDLERVKGGPHASIMRYTLARGPGMVNPTSS